MTFLVDTNIFLFWITGESRLPNSYKKIIMDEQHTIYISSVVVWEISIKQSIKKLKLPNNYIEYIRDAGFIELPISFAHAQHIQSLPNIHRDPFDRMLISQSFIEDIPILTIDPVFKKYKANVIPF